MTRGSCRRSPSSQTPRSPEPGPRARDCVLLIRCVYLLLFKSFKSKCAHHRINENKIKRKVPWSHFYLHYLFVKKIQFIRIFFNKLLTLFSRAAPMGAGGGGGARQWQVLSSEAGQQQQHDASTRVVCLHHLRGLSNGSCVRAKHINCDLSPTDFLYK